MTKEQKEKESELIANGIMISVQSNKYGTNIYNTEINDFNHYHLQMAARKGIELGLKAAQKAFIEKACEWLKKYGGGYWMDDYDLPTDELVNDFRNYMKGE